MIVFEPRRPVERHLIVDKSPGPNVKYPDFLGSPLRGTLAVPPRGAEANFVPPSSGICPTLPWGIYCKVLFCEVEVNTEVEVLYGVWLYWAEM